MRITSRFRSSTQQCPRPIGPDRPTPPRGKERAGPEKKAVEKRRQEDKEQDGDGVSTGDHERFYCKDSAGGDGSHEEKLKIDGHIEGGEGCGDSEKENSSETRQKNQRKKPTCRPGVHLLQQAVGQPSQVNKESRDK